MEPAVDNRRGRTRGGAIVAVNPTTMKVERTFEYANVAAASLGVSRQTISSALRKGYRAKGFLLFYKTTYESMIKE